MTTNIIDKFVGGSELTLQRTIEDVPAALTQAKLGIKNTPDDLDVDALVLKTITTSPTADGQITDTGAGDGVAGLFFKLTPTETRLLEGPRYRYFEIKCYPTGGNEGVVDSGQIRLRKGVIDT